MLSHFGWEHPWWLFCTCDWKAWKSPVKKVLVLMLQAFSWKFTLKWTPVTYFSKFLNYVQRRMPTTGCFCRRGMVGTRNWHGSWHKIQLRFERYFSFDRSGDGRSISWNVALIKHTCSWRDKLVILWTLNRQAKKNLRRQNTAFSWFWVQTK